jgi:uncharacterized protein YggE
MKTLLSTAAIAGLLAMASPSTALAQAASPPPAGAVFAATTLNLDAYGEARAAPDMATLTLGVESSDATAAAAMADNAARMTQVVGALRHAGLPERDLQTSSLSLAPQYVYAQNQPPRLTGYKASNQLVVTVSDLAHLGVIADAAVAAGATDIGQIDFGLANPRAAEDSARLAAVKALEDKASLYANAVGYRIVRLVNLSEGVADAFQPPRPMMAAMSLRAAAPTPVETGELKVRIDITGAFELAR